MLYTLIIVGAVFFLFWIWMVKEVKDAPVYPDDYEDHNDPWL